ncbi:MAG: hypothetical protein V5B44_11910 [Candidatus Accumulibacter necessarius]|uniref:hypothetical protein n=1 Tax=Candidatus Accumulibacter necessarius TaxID=2954386 RepID=UPI002FC3488F
MSNELIPHSNLEGARAWCHVIYGLHALAVVVGVTGAATFAGAFVFGVPSLIAVVLNYLKRGEVAGPGSTATIAGRSGPSGSRCSGCWSTAC